MTQAKFKRLKAGAKVRFNSEYCKFLLDKAYQFNVSYKGFNHESALCFVLISLGDYKAVLRDEFGHNNSRQVSVTFPKFPGLEDRFYTDATELV